MSQDLQINERQAIAIAGLSGNIGAEDIKFPRIEILQALSPSVVDGTHKAGMLLNSLTREPLPEALKLTPCFAFKSAIKWRARETGGGIEYKTSNFTDPKYLKDMQWNGMNPPAATLYINVICLVDGQDIPLVASFCKTGYKTGTDFISLIALSGSAWRYTYIMTAKHTKNTKGQFFVPQIRRAELTPADLASRAAELSKQVASMQDIGMDYEANETAEAQGAAPTPEEF